MLICVTNSNCTLTLFTIIIVNAFIFGYKFTVDACHLYQHFDEKYLASRLLDHLLLINQNLIINAS